MVASCVLCVFAVAGLTRYSWSCFGRACVGWTSKAQSRNTGFLAASSEVDPGQAHPSSSLIFHNCPVVVAGGTSDLNGYVFAANTV